MKNILLVFPLFFLATLSFSQNFEQKFLENLSKHRTVGMTHFMQGVSNSTNDISIAVPVGLFIASAISHDKDMEKKSFVVAGSIVISTILTEGIKIIVNRPRPSTKDSLIIPASAHGSSSFPSGHSSEAFSTATAISLAYPKWYVITPSFLWAGTVGFSRMYLGVHYPSDVLAGAIVGSGSAWLAYKINQWLRKPHQHHNLQQIN
jgi:membrane-associated phospholipid phosphatase